MSSNDLGRLGEQVFRFVMRERGYTLEDVTNNSNYFDKDIDFLVTSPFTGAVKSFEVKYDNCINYTRNLYLELTNINSKQWDGDGWWLHCDADYLAYGDAATRNFHIIKLNELKERVKELPERLGHCSNESTGLLVSLDDIKDITLTI